MKPSPALQFTTEVADTMHRGIPHSFAGIGLFGAALLLITAVDSMSRLFVSARRARAG